jgi:hypothetical protein
LLDFGQLLCDLVNLLELYFPPAVVQEGSHVEPIVVKAIALLVESWRKGDNLVAVQRVESKELLHLVGNLLRCHVSVMAPVEQQVGVHRQRPHAVDLPQRSKKVQLQIGETHKLLI